MVNNKGLAYLQIMGKKKLEYGKMVNVINGWMNKIKNYIQNLFNNQNK